MQMLIAECLDWLTASSLQGETCTDNSEVVVQRYVKPICLRWNPCAIRTEDEAFVPIWGADRDWKVTARNLGAFDSCQGSLGPESSGLSDVSFRHAQGSSGLSRAFQMI